MSSCIEFSCQPPSWFDPPIVLEGYLLYDSIPVDFTELYSISWNNNIEPWDLSLAIWDFTGSVNLQAGDRMLTETSQDLIIVE